MSMNEQLKNKLIELKKLFTEDLKYKNIVLLAYIFGSQLTGKTGPLSDYDFAFLLVDKLPLPFQLKYELQNKLATVFDHGEIDLVILNNAPIELKYHIITTGKLIFQKESFIRVEFEADTLSLYFDYLPVLQAQKQDILNFKHGGAKHAQRIQRYRAALRKTEEKLRQWTNQKY